MQPTKFLAPINFRLINDRLIVKLDSRDIARFDDTDDDRSARFNFFGISRVFAARFKIGNASAREKLRRRSTSRRTRTSNVYTSVRVRINLMNRDVCMRAYVHLMPIPITKGRWKKTRRVTARRYIRTRKYTRVREICICTYPRARTHIHTLAAQSRSDYQIYSLLAGGIVWASNVTSPGGGRVFRRIAARNATATK